MVREQTFRADLCDRPCAADRVSGPVAVAVHDYRNMTRGTGRFSGALSFFRVNTQPVSLPVYPSSGRFSCQFHIKGDESAAPNVVSLLDRKRFRSIGERTRAYARICPASTSARRFAAHSYAPDSASEIHAPLFTDFCENPISCRAAGSGSSGLSFCGFADFFATIASTS